MLIHFKIYLKNLLLHVFKQAKFNEKTDRKNKSLCNIIQNVKAVKGNVKANGLKVL